MINALCYLMTSHFNAWPSSKMTFVTSWPLILLNDGIKMTLVTSWPFTLLDDRHQNDLIDLMTSLFTGWPSWKLTLVTQWPLILPEWPSWKMALVTLWLCLSSKMHLVTLSPLILLNNHMKTSLVTLRPLLSQNDWHLDTTTSYLNAFFCLLFNPYPGELCDSLSLLFWACLRQQSLFFSLPNQAGST